MKDDYLNYSGLFDKIRKFYFRKLLKQCKAKTGMNILDYGCGPGDFILISEEFGLNSMGVDSQIRSVNMAKARGMNVEHGDALTLNFDENQFDIIILQSVIEHVTDPVNLLSVLMKSLKKNGKLIVSAPTPGPHFWDDPTHIRPYTIESFETLANILNLDILYKNYTFSFLLGIRLKSSIFYKFLNLMPFSLGSNVFAIFKKK